ncbi:MAG: 50S ribosomal protein L18 [Minisyncoccia bacterium]|jgi:large subunit ribosomal protein L18
MNARKKLNQKRIRRAARVSARLYGTASVPRLVVSRSNRYVYAQLVDDVKNHTIVAVSSFGKGGAAVKGTKSVQAFATGEALAKKALEKGIARVVFDRRSSKFHGRIQQFAEGAKKGGLKM